MILARDILALHFLMNNTLLETILITDGKIHNLYYHQQRCDNSLRALNIQTRYHLINYIKPPETGIFRCRILYDAKKIKVTYHPYHISAIHSLKLLFSEIEYPLKFANRAELNALYEQRQECTDVAIIKQDYLTDTTKANIALYDGSSWYTPKAPLLYGTTRARLLDEKKIIPLHLHVREIEKFSKVAIMNAMIGFCEVENGIIL